jgi:hypothetical protein
VTVTEQVRLHRRHMAPNCSRSKHTVTCVRCIRTQALAGHTWRSDSPMYMLMSSGPLTDRKLSAHSVATALASSVLPVPAAHLARSSRAHASACSAQMQPCTGTDNGRYSAMAVYLADHTAARPNAAAARWQTAAGGAAAAPPCPGSPLSRHQGHPHHPTWRWLTTHKIDVRHRQARYRCTGRAGYGEQQLAEWHQGLFEMLSIQWQL